MPLNNNDIPNKQRALVLQGGGALGAYEAGVLSVLCKELAHEYREGPLFDIVAATSMGAMNAAVLVGNVVNRKKTWEEAAKELENFWTDEGRGLSSTPGFSNLWWEQAKMQKKFSASPEAARRYYSVKEYLKYGTPNVFSPLPPEPDSKFADQDNTWIAHDSSPLQNTIERYSKDENNEKLSIATSWRNREPRLLVISVDVAEGKTVAFDSYHTKAEEDPDNSLYEGDGITIDHVMASGTIPIFYKFREIPTKGGRKFCDGGILSNTPFRELLQAHRDYWNGIIVEDNDNKIPDLDVYIINVHPSKQDKVPADLDGVKDRINDITFMDRNSHYDEMVANLVTDYTDLIDRLKELAKSYFENIETKDITFQNELESLLKSVEAKTSRVAGEDKYKDGLLKGRFRITKVIRIENESYKDSISGKVGDFTSQSIRNLIEKGKQDARRVLELQ
jgi:NTE family protein